MTAPSRAQVIEMMTLLLAGGLTREAASLWAGPLHVREALDPLVEEALDLLTLTDAWQVDAEGTRTGYLFDFADIVAIRDLLLMADDGPA